MGEEKNLIIDFWAEWCGPCKSLKPTVEKLADEYKDKGVEIISINIEEDQDNVSGNYNVKSIPTVVFLKDGKEETRFVGTKTYQDFKDLITKVYSV